MKNKRDEYLKENLTDEEKYEIIKAIFESLEDDKEKEDDEIEV